MSCIKSWRRNWLYVMSCIKSRRRNWLHVMTCIKSWRRNWLHEMSCIKSRRLNWLYVMSCIKSCRRNWLYVMSCIKSRRGNWLYVMSCHIDQRLKLLGGIKPRKHTKVIRNAPHPQDKLWTAFRVRFGPFMRLSIDQTSFQYQYQLDSRCSYTLLNLYQYTSLMTQFVYVGRRSRTCYVLRI